MMEAEKSHARLTGSWRNGSQWRGSIQDQRHEDRENRWCTSQPQSGGLRTWGAADTNSQVQRGQRAWSSDAQGHEKMGVPAPEERENSSLLYLLSTPGLTENIHMGWGTVFLTQSTDAEASLFWTTQCQESHFFLPLQLEMLNLLQCSQWLMMNITNSSGEIHPTVFPGLSAGMLSLWGDGEGASLGFSLWSSLASHGGRCRSKLSGEHFHNSR